MKDTRVFILLRTRFVSNKLFLILSLFLMQFVLYGQGIFNSFVADDRTYFLDNDLFNNLNFNDFFKLFTVKTNYWGEHLPLRDYLYLIQKNEFLTNPLPYHLVSFFMFSFFILIVYKLFNVFDEEDEKKRFIGFISTAFYISHPALVECVSYVSGQKDLLCGIFTSLTIFFLVRYFKENSLYLITLFCIFYYMAIFSKSVAIINFLAIIVVYYYFQKNKKIYLDSILWLIFNIPAFLWILYSLGVVTNGPSAKADQNILFQLINAIKIIGWQFYIMIKIYPRSFGYPYIENEVDIYFFIGLFVCIFFLFAFIFTKNVFIRTGILLWFIFLIPVLRIFYSVSNAGVFDRYLFLPLLGLSIIIYGILKQYKYKYLIAAVLLVVVINSVSTFFSIANFKDDIAITANNYRVYPLWNRTSFEYASALIEGGKFEEAESLIEKEKVLQRPAWVIPFFRGWIALERGDLPHAEEQLRVAAVHTASGRYYPFPNIPLARTLLQAGKNDAADIFLQRVVALGGPANPVEYFKAKSLLNRQ